ncbi:MAG: AAA family ATPase [Chloroflexota bacterium]|nr:AAA family ATPase [Chloroflexota bacterium]
MKIGVSGKGGVGKTLLASRLSRAFADAGYSVIAIDADPDANLAATLGFPNPDSIVPISELSGLIEERTGAKPGTVAPFYKLNPRVDDLPEDYSVKVDGIRLMVMGRIKRGGTGCYCPEGALLQALLSHLLVARDEVVILDMEAGIEHLARGTAKAVDRLVIVVEPGRRSIETASRIKDLALDLGLESIAVVGNKIRDESEKDFITASLPGFDFIGFIPYDQALVDADIGNLPLVESSPRIADAVQHIFQALLDTPSTASGGKQAE